MKKYEVYMKEGSNPNCHTIEADRYHRYSGEGLKLAFQIGNNQDIAIFDEDQVVAIVIKESK